MPRVLISLLAFLVFGTVSAAAAEANQFPGVSGEVLIELQNDFAYASDDPVGDFNTLFTTIEPTINFGFSEQLNLMVHFTFEPVQEPAPDGDSVIFETQGLFVEDLVLSFDVAQTRLFGGKFTVRSGIAWDRTPGIFGTDLAEEYELSERLGLGASYTLAPTGFGKHTATFSVFRADTTVLAESAFTRRPRLRRADGGPGNNDDISSFGIAIESEDVKALPGFGYHLSLVHQGQGRVSESDEQRYAVSLTYDAKVTKDVTLSSIFEYIRFDNADGVRDQDRDYITAGLGLDWRSWKLAVSFTGKDTEPSGGVNTHEEQFQVSLGYTFANKIGLTGGWKRARNDGVDTDILGVLVDYTYLF